MYLEGFLKSPSTVRVLAPDVWKVATGLAGRAGPEEYFSRRELRRSLRLAFRSQQLQNARLQREGRPHRIVIDGEGNYDPERMRRDVQKIVETQVELMGGEIPYRDYTFILHLRSNAGGGLEHLNSTALGYPRFGFRIRSGDRATSAAPNATNARTRLSRFSFARVARVFSSLERETNSSGRARAI
jgi:predicted metalloprotease with PDZ domain